jgi:hypothetical protein
MVANSVDQNVYEEEKKEEKRRKGQEANFPGTPQELAEDPNWEDVTHPDQRKAGHQEFQNPETGVKIRFDKGEPGRPGHEGHDHYHKYKEDPVTGKKTYFDSEGNPTKPHSGPSHLYPPEGIYWII